MAARKDRIEMIPLASLADNPFQIGYPPAEGEVTRSAYLVRDHGLTIPLVVRPRGRAFQLGTGRRWLAACRLLGVARVPALVRELGDDEMAAFAFEEAGQEGQISPGHGALLREAIQDAWVSDRMAKLRRGEEGFRIRVDPEAARNLPLPQRLVMQPAPAPPASVPSPKAPAAPASPPPAPRGIHDTLLGVRCRVVPPMWFQTVSEAGRRWVLESMNSAGQIEIEGVDFSVALFDEAKIQLCQWLAERFPGAEFSEGVESARGGIRVLALDVLLPDADIHHRFVLLWKPGRGVSFHLSNTKRFFLYDVKTFAEMVEAAELI